MDERLFSAIDCLPSSHGETPGDEQIERFIQVCNEYSNLHPDHIIGRVKIHVCRDFFKKNWISFLQVFIVHTDLIELDFSSVHISVGNMT